MEKIRDRQNSIVKFTIIIEGKMSEFIHLHNHSHYSILDGITKIPDLLETTRLYSQKAVALTDHGNMFGAMEFQKECKNFQIKPIFGAELYIAPKNRYEKDKDEKYYHIVLLAKDNTGYKNLMKLTSIGYLEGFYSKPRIDKAVLSEYSKGLVVLTACLGGELPSMILNENEKGLNQAIDWYTSVFGKENFFLEIQNHNLPEELTVIKRFIEISGKTGIKLVATNDSHYLQKEDSILQEIVFAIRDKTTMKDPKRQKFANDEFYLKSPDIMSELFSGIQESLSNSLLINEMCNVNIDYAKHTPLFALPDNKTADDYLMELCRTGLNKRFTEKSPPQNYTERLELELELIKKMGFSNYFLIVSDFVRYARDTGVLVGPGRGSAAGALLSYSLGITDIDPLQYNLLFERFLNPERVSMPDIDVDFQDDRRDEVKEYIRMKYGYNKTADIITFGVMKSRASLKDVGRVLEIPLENVNRLTKLIDNKTANEALSIVINMVPELKNIQEKGSPLEKQWIEYSIKLDGTIRNIGTHASGLIISDSDLTDIVPLYRDVSSGLVSTQFEGEYLEKNGLLKMDILGLSNLSMIKICLEKIKINHNFTLDISKILLDDRPVYQLFWRGETMGIFQFESGGMTDYLKKLKPTSIEDLIAMNALYRPGPMDNIPSFIARKTGKEPIDCFHANLEPILKSTYGVIVYQEQVMQIAQVLAGFSLGKADVVRRIMAKKKPEELDKIRPEWIEGSIKNGYTKELAERIFEILVPFSNYAFNKSHSAAYAVLAYQIAYLKAHYILEFMTSLLTLNMGNNDQVKLYCQEASAREIEILSPDINQSIWEFRETIKNGQKGIIFGFGGIKGLGEGVSDSIINERELGGLYASFDDFIRRIMKYVEFKKGAVEILIKAGCFDNFFSEENYLQEKSILLHNLEVYIDQAQKHEKDKKAGQMGLFGSHENNGFEIHTNRNFPPLTLKEEFENEVSIFGFYLSGKLFSHHMKNFGRISCCSNQITSRLKPGTGILIWGFIQEVQIKIANNKKNYAIILLDNGFDNFKFFLFSEKYDQFKNLLVENNFIMIRFNIVEGNKGIQYDVVNIKPIEYLRQERFTQLHICFEGEEASEEIKNFLNEIKTMLDNPINKGITQFVFHIFSNQGNFTVYSSDKYRIRYSNSLMDKIENMSDIQAYWLY